MPILPHRANILLDYQKIYQLLLACQQNCQKSNCTQIISISLEIGLVDPFYKAQEFISSCLAKTITVCDNKNYLLNLTPPDPGE